MQHTLQHTATHGNKIKHTATHCNTLQHNATHCNTMQHNATHTATHCNTLQNTAIHYKTLQHHLQKETCNTLQHTATHCNTLQHAATRCNTLQHTAIHCNTLQRTATTCVQRHLQHAPCYGSSPPCNAWEAIWSGATHDTSHHLAGKEIIPFQQKQTDKPNLEYATLCRCWVWWWFCTLWRENPSFQTKVPSSPSLACHLSRWFFFPMSLPIIIPFGGKSY